MKTHKISGKPSEGNHDDDFDAPGPEEDFKKHMRKSPKEEKEEEGQEKEGKSAALPPIKEGKEGGDSDEGEEGFEDSGFSLGTSPTRSSSSDNNDDSTQKNFDEEMKRMEAELKEKLEEEKQKELEEEQEQEIAAFEKLEREIQQQLEKISQATSDFVSGVTKTKDQSEKGMQESLGGKPKAGATSSSKDTYSSEHIEEIEGTQVQREKEIGKSTPKPIQEEESTTFSTRKPSRPFEVYSQEKKTKKTSPSTPQVAQSSEFSPEISKDLHNVPKSEKESDIIATSQEATKKGPTMEKQSTKPSLQPHKEEAYPEKAPDLSKTTQPAKSSSLEEHDATLSKRDSERVSSKKGSEEISSKTGLPPKEENVSARPSISKGKEVPGGIAKSEGEQEPHPSSPTSDRENKAQPISGTTTTGKQTASDQEIRSVSKKVGKKAETGRQISQHETMKSEEAQKLAQERRLESSAKKEQTLKGGGEEKTLKERKEIKESGQQSDKSKALEMPSSGTPMTPHMAQPAAQSASPETHSMPPETLPPQIQNLAKELEEQLSTYQNNPDVQETKLTLSSGGFDKVEVTIQVTKYRPYEINLTFGNIQPGQKTILDKHADKLKKFLKTNKGITVHQLITDVRRSR